MEIEVIEVMESISSEPLELNIILAMVVMVYVGFSLYFLLEKFKVKE